MTMKKKFIAMLTIATLSLSLLAGCGQQATTNTNEDTSTEQNTEDVVVEEVVEEQPAEDVGPNTFIKIETYNVTHGYSSEDTIQPDVHTWVVSSTIEMTDNTTGDVITQSEEKTNEQLEENADFYWVSDISIARGLCTTGELEKMGGDTQTLTINGIKYIFEINDCSIEGNYDEIKDCVMTYTFEGIYYTEGNELNSSAQSQEPIVVAVEEPVAEAEPTPEEVVDGEEVTINYEYAYNLTFPNGMTGFTKKYLNETVPEWSLNETHYVDTNGNKMNFEWEGFATLGENAGVNGNTLNLVDPERGTEIRAWYGGPMNMEDIEPCLTADSTAWTNSTSAYCSLPENGYYKVEQIENTVVITYEVIDNNSGKVGYVRFICNADIGKVYNFMYLETPEIFDKDRAMFVINSIEFWDYTP